MMSIWVDLGLTLVLAGISYVLKRYRNKIKAIFDLVDKIEKAVEDGTLTEEELREIIKKIKEIANGRW